jgi:citrate lyase beta subunit
VVNEVFSPTEKEIEWAKEVVEAYEEANAAGSGAISIDGQMIDAASIRMARNTLDQAPDLSCRSPSVPSLGSRRCKMDR